ncbi:tape measure protein [Acinetobacter radioresistens]|uniref:tape measure protein n=2 Tax=Bacteria TaxID=2 RepID=UPI0006191D16|nr:tape measure protein [Acinetobacter radioresistens]
MAGKELTFKLVMEADTKNYVSNIKDSESVTKALYAAIKQESERLKAASEEAAQVVGKIVPDDLQKKADQAKGKLSEVSQAAGELEGQAIQATSKIDGLGNELQDTAVKANKAGFEIGEAIPGDALQLAEMLGTKFFSAAKEIEALGDKSVISAGELRSMSSTGEQSLSELNSALKAAQAELVRLQNTDGTLKDIEIAKDRVLSIEDAIKETSSAFNYYQGVAINAMRGVDNATQSSINQLQRFSSVDLGQVVGEAQTATRAIQSMGEGANLSTKEIERIGTIGTSSINTLESELLAAKNAFSALEQSSEAVTLEEIKAAGEKVKGLEQAVDLTKAAFADFDTQASSAMRSVSTSADKAATSAKQTGHEIYEALGIKPPTVINDAITALERKLEDFKANSKLPAEEVERVTKITEQQIEKLKDELHGVEPAAEKANSGVSNLSKGMGAAKFAATALAGAMAAVGIGIGVREIAQVADSYTNLSARINIATKEGGNFTTAMAGVHQVALATNSSLEATGDLFTRLNVVAKDMGMSQQQALDLTKTVTQAIKIGGGSAEASEAAVQQFIQAMQGGVLRGEEFNSIMEGGYGLAEALARGLGVTTGELRKMAENGELTAERVVKALHSQADAVQETYNQFPITISNALQKISTQWQILIGEMDQASGTSASVAGALSVIADNLGILKTYINDIGEGFTWIGDKLLSIDASTIETLKSTLSEAYETVKSLISNVASLGETMWSAFTTALDAVSPLFAAILSGKEDVSGLETVLNLLRMAFATVSDVALGFNVGLKLLLSGIQFLSGGIYALSSQILRFIGFNTLADQSEKASDRMFAQAEKNLDDAKKLAEEHKWAIVETYNEIGKTQEQKDAERITQNQQTLDQLKAQEEKHKADYKAISDERIRLNQQLEDARRSGNQASIDLAVKGLADLDAKEKAYQAESQKITDGKIQAAQEWINAQLAALDGTQKVADLATQKTLQTTLAAQGLKVEFDNSGKAIVSAMQQGTAATEGQTNATDKARKAAAALGIDLDVALNRVSEKFATDRTHLNSYASGLESMGVTGSRATELIYQGWEKWAEQAKSPAELDAAKAQLISFEEQGVFSAKQVQAGMEYLDQVNGKLPANISEVEKAYRLLGLTSREEASKIADAQMKAFNLLKQSGTASIEQLRQALINMADKIYASGDAAKIAAYESQLAYHGLTSEVDSSGKAAVKTMDDWAKANNRVESSASAIGDGYREAGRVAREEAKSSTEAWSEALTAMQGKLKASKTGVMAKNGYSVDEIEQQLTEMGYGGNVKQKAKELFQTAQQGAGGYYRSASHEYAARYGVSAYDNQKQTGNYMFIAEQLEKLEEYAGKSGSVGAGSKARTVVPEVNINSLAPDVSYPKTSLPVSDPARTVRYEFDLGNGKTATMYGSPNDGDDLESMLRKLEMIKKSS